LGLVWDGQYFWNVSGSVFGGGNHRIYQVSNPITAIDKSFINKPGGFFLLQNYPNPFSQTTTMNYHLSSKINIELKIYNQTGQEIKTLVETQQNVGEYQIQWDGRDSQNNIVPNGIYYYQLKSGKYSETRKMIFLR